MIQAWADSNGGEGDQGNIFALAGLLGPAERWALFSDEWTARLASAPSIKYFVTREAVRREGQFNRWSRPNIDAKVKALAKALDTHGFTSFHCALDIPGFVAAKAETNHIRPSRPPYSPLEDCYFLPFHTAIRMVCQEVLAGDRPEPFEMTFDEDVIFGPRAKAEYSFLRRSGAFNERERAVLPVEPMFRDDKRYVPLQAADMIAWLARQRYSNAPPRALAWLPDEFSKTKESAHSKFWPQERMVTFLSATGTAKELDQGTVDALNERRRELGLPDLET